MEAAPSSAASHLQRVLKPPTDVLSAGSGCEVNGGSLQTSTPATPAVERSLNSASATLVENYPLESARAWAEPFPAQETPGKSKLRVPLKVVILVTMCVFTLAPALVLWLVSWDAGNGGVQSVNALGRRSVEEAASQLLTSLMENAATTFMAMITPSMQLLTTLVMTLEGSGMLKWDGRTIGRNFSTVALPRIYPLLFYPLKSSPFIYAIGYSVFSDTVHNYPQQTLVSDVQWISLTRHDLNIFTNARVPTIYTSENIINPFRNGTTVTYYVLDQISGSKRYSFYQSSSSSGLGTVILDPSTPAYFKWRHDLYFHPVTGLPLLYFECHVPFDDGLASHEIQVYTETYTVSAFLRSMLNGPKERLALSFHNPAGSLIGASHGKFFSHSDFDFSKNNPIVKPPPIALFRRYTMLNSTDSIIREAAEWLIGAYLSWEFLPGLITTVPLDGEDYWLANSVLTGEHLLRMNLVLLIDRASRMGVIEANTAATLSGIYGTNARLMILLCLVLVGAVCFAVGISIQLSRPLQWIAAGMDRLAVLQLEGVPEFGPKLSRMTEVSRLETSFLSLRRGMSAFVKYVPRDVVRQMLMGELGVGSHMERRVVTILFMDIAGFSSLSEELDPEPLITLTTEYMQAMCDVIVSYSGTLDKFIGDCIMALWNAPR
eukprot:RCo052278